MENIKKPKIYAAFIVFAAAVLLLIFAAAPMQLALGMWGLFLTEVMLAACAVAAVYIFRYDIREAIPLRLPKLRQVFGVLLIWVGSLLVGYLATFVTLMLFPSEMTELSKALGDFITDAPYLPALFISAVMPALCEETLCRGFIQYSLGGIKSKWLAIILVGVLFGVFHLSLYRLMPTMILGLALAYIMSVTRNIALPMIVHFINNAASLTIAFAAAGVQTAAPDAGFLSKASVIYIGIVLFVCAAVPWLLIAGSRLLRPKAENRQAQRKNKPLIAAAVVSAVCFTSGIAVTAAGAMSLMGDMQVLNMSYTEYVSSASDEEDTYPVLIEADGNYQLSYVLMAGPGADGTTRFTLTGPDGEEYLGMTVKSIYGNTQKYLTSGEYTLTYAYDYENGDPAPVEISFIIMKALA